MTIPFVRASNRGEGNKGGRDYVRVAAAASAPEPAAAAWAAAVSAGPEPEAAWAVGPAAA